MTRQPQTVDDLDEYQRTVLAGLYARRELDQGYRLSARQKQLILDDYLAELSAPPNTRRPRNRHSTLPEVADYHWHPPTPARRPRGR